MSYECSFVYHPTNDPEPDVLLLTGRTPLELANAVRLEFNEMPRYVETATVSLGKTPASPNQLLLRRGNFSLYSVANWIQKAAQNRPPVLAPSL